MDKSKGWILVIGILVILTVVGMAFISTLQNFQETTENTLGPVNQITGELSTQIANILNPTPTILPDPVTIVHDVRSLARLETIQYSLEKVITAETRQGAFSFFVGDKLLFIAHGIVIAGIDLEKLQPEDLRVEENVLYVKLPEAEIFIATLDNDKSYVYDRDTGLFTKGEINLETLARQAAEDEIHKAAIEDGILEQAQINGENFMWRLLQDLGFPEVIFE